MQFIITKLQLIVILSKINCIKNLNYIYRTDNFLRDVLEVPKLSLLERRDVKRVKPIRPIPTYIQSDAGFGEFGGVGLSSPISPTFGMCVFSINKNIVNY